MSNLILSSSPNKLIISSNSPILKPLQLTNKSSSISKENQPSLYLTSSNKLDIPIDNDVDDLKSSSPMNIFNITSQYSDPLIINKTNKSYLNISELILIYCDICGTSDNNIYLTCTSCNISIHSYCSGLNVSLFNESFECEKCKLKDAINVVKCSICPFTEGYFIKTNSNIVPTNPTRSSYKFFDTGYMHACCAIMMNELNYIPSEATVYDLHRLNNNRFQRCYYCGLNSGACLSCHHSTCSNFIHVKCAIKLKLLTFLRFKSNWMSYFLCNDHTHSSPASLKPLKLTNKCDYDSDNNSPPAMDDSFANVVNPHHQPTEKLSEKIVVRKIINNTDIKKTKANPKESVFLLHEITSPCMEFNPDLKHHIWSYFRVSADTLNIYCSLCPAGSVFYRFSEECLNHLMVKHDNICISKHREIFGNVLDEQITQPSLALIDAFDFVTDTPITVSGNLTTPGRNTSEQKNFPAFLESFKKVFLIANPNSTSMQIYKAGTAEWAKLQNIKKGSPNYPIFESNIPSKRKAADENEFEEPSHSTRKIKLTSPRESDIDDIKPNDPQKAAWVRPCSEDRIALYIPAHQVDAKFNKPLWKYFYLKEGILAQFQTYILCNLCKSEIYKNSVAGNTECVHHMNKYHKAE